MVFKELIDYSYTLGGTIYLKFSDDKETTQSIEFIRVPKTIFNVFSKRRSKSILVNNKRINKNKASTEKLRCALKNYLNKHDRQFKILDDLPLVSDNLSFNRELPEYLFADWEYSQGDLLIKWAIDRIDGVEYSRPTWVDKKLKEINEIKSETKPKEDSDLSDEEFDNIITQLKEKGEVEIKLEK